MNATSSVLNANTKALQVWGPLGWGSTDLRRAEALQRRRALVGIRRRDAWIVRRMGRHEKFRFARTQLLRAQDHRGAPTVLLRLGWSLEGSAIRCPGRCFE